MLSPSIYRAIFITFQCAFLSSLFPRFAQAFQPTRHSFSFSSTVAPPTTSTTLNMATNRGTATSAEESGLFLRTPLIRSEPLSKLTGRDIYIKLDCLQPSGSFKDRGMANLCQTLSATKGTTKLIASSGGNAGLAVAMVGKKQGMSVSVVVPSSTKAHVIEKLKSLNADVTVHGKIWNEADVLARQMVEEDPEAEYCSPYDNPLLWAGHSTLVDEIVEDISDLGAIIVSVGGGGLICGVLEGLERHGKTSKVVACETEGAASFCQSWLQGGERVLLETINTVATSLGAIQVTEVSIQRSQKHESNGGKVEAAICTDKEAVEACLKFSEDHRLLVEPACGAGLAALYSDRLREQTLEGVEGPIVVEVCGGSGVNLDLLATWKKDLGIE